MLLNGQLVFLLSQTLLLNIPHHTLHFPLFPEQGCRVQRWLRFWLSLPLLFLGSDVMWGSQCCPPFPFSLSLSLLVLIFLQGESCVCIRLCFCTKETHCVFRVDFWLNKFELSLVQQGSSRSGDISNLEADPGLLASLLPAGISQLPAGQMAVC